MVLEAPGTPTEESSTLGDLVERMRSQLSRLVPAVAAGLASVLFTAILPFLIEASLVTWPLSEP